MEIRPAEISEILKQQIASFDSEANVAEVGTVLTELADPARAAQRFVELALARGGADNATAVVMRVAEAGARPHPAEHRRRDDEVIQRCPLWGTRLSPQQRLRALRARRHVAG